MRDVDVTKVSRQSIAAGSKSFAAAARLFDPVTRDSARMFYNWCRHCDDVIDGQASGHGLHHYDGTTAERLAGLEARTWSALGGEAQVEPAFAALQRVVQRHRLPRHLPMDILAGFRMDVEERRYASIEDLLAYCYGVAGAVGVSMAVIMGVDANETDTLDRACDLGLGFQLTNIARDVMDDARIGRVYLPGALFKSGEVEPGQVLDPRNRREVVGAAHAVLELAERYYASARIGIARLPWRSAWAVSTARGVYREIGQRVRAAPDPWVERQVVPTHRKLWHVAAASMAPLTYRSLADRPRHGLWTRASWSSGAPRQLPQGETVALAGDGGGVRELSR